MLNKTKRDFLLMRVETSQQQKHTYIKNAMLSYTGKNYSFLLRKKIVGAYDNFPCTEVYGD